MELRRAGRSGLELSVLGLGTLAWGTRVDQWQAVDLLRRFRDLGGTFVDTSTLWADGAAVEVLAKAVSESGGPDGLRIACSAGVVLDAGRTRVDVTRSGLLRQLDSTLQKLGVERLDLWQLEAWDGTVPLGETLSALALALNSGKVAHVGVAGLPAWQLVAVAKELDKLATGVGFASVRTEHSLLDRSAERDVLPALEHLGLGLLACSPLGRGVLTGKYRTGTPADSMAADPSWEPYVADHLERGSSGLLDALQRAADGLGVWPGAVALAWLRDRPEVTSLVAGPRTPEQLEQVVAALETELPEPIAEALDDVTRRF